MLFLREIRLQSKHNWKDERLAPINERCLNKTRPDANISTTSSILNFSLSPSIKMKSYLPLFTSLSSIITAQVSKNPCTGRLESINITTTPVDSYSSTIAVEFYWHRPRWVQYGKHSPYGNCDNFGNYLHFYVNSTLTHIPMLEFRNVDHLFNRTGAAVTDDWELKWHLTAAGSKGIKLEVMDHGRM